jgi:CubicO group peptidase (beta-lactamase class C family)
MWKLMIAVCGSILPALGMAAEPAPPASALVAFDRATITPLIAEGFANKQTGRTVDANDPARIASISKLVMALTTLRLMDEGKIDLARDISDYLGWRLRSPLHADAPVTIEHLLTHRAGLSDKAGYIVPLGESLAAKLADPAAWRDTAAPGNADYEYANLGSPLVATALEAASGERYDRLVERLVFAPLGITACLNWTLCEPEFSARAVTLYRDTGEIARDDPADLPPNCTIPVGEGEACSLDGYVPGTNASVFSPQGGVRIGMVDLARLGQALANLPENGFLKAETYRKWIESAETIAIGTGTECGYGIGLKRIEATSLACDDPLFGDGRARIGHAGEAYGLRSGLWLDPVSGKGVAFFTTEVPPPAGGEDTGGFDPREVALIARAKAMMQP